MNNRCHEFARNLRADVVQSRAVFTTFSCHFHAFRQGFLRVLEREMIKFGILGAGRIGKVHTATIGASSRAKVAFVADAMAKAASDLAATVGAKVASVDEIIASKDVDAILIATPTGTHA